MFLGPPRIAHKSSPTQETPPLTGGVTGQKDLCLCAFSFPDSFASEMPKSQNHHRRQNSLSTHTGHTPLNPSKGGADSAPKTGMEQKKAHKTKSHRECLTTPKTPDQCLSKNDLFCQKKRRKCFYHTYSTSSLTFNLFSFNSFCFFQIPLHTKILPN